jgi:hypothetical protein
MVRIIRHYKWAADEAIQKAQVWIATLPAKVRNGDFIATMG